MGCGNLFFSVVISFSAALITYNIIISANASLKQEFPGNSNPSSLSKSSSSFSVGGVDPIIKMPTDNNKSKSKSKRKRLFHTAVTSSDSIYNTWQSRVMYYWFKQQKLRNPDSEMGGFTRILHSGNPDRFMDEIPTFVANPLPEGMDQVCFFSISISLFVFSSINNTTFIPDLLPLTSYLLLYVCIIIWQGYIVLNRPWAFVQWLQKANIEEEYGTEPHLTLSCFLFRVISSFLFLQLHINV